MDTKTVTWRGRPAPAGGLGLRATAADMAPAEAGGTDDESAAAWVADNLAVVNEALRTSRPPKPLRGR